jgi:hypothetical protein
MVETTLPISLWGNKGEISAIEHIREKGYRVTKDKEGSTPTKV